MIHGWRKGAAPAVLATQASHTQSLRFDVFSVQGVPRAQRFCPDRIANVILRSTSLFKVSLGLVKVIAPADPI